MDSCKDNSSMNKKYVSDVMSVDVFAGCSQSTIDRDSDYSGYLKGICCREGWIMIAQF